MVKINTAESNFIKMIKSKFNTSFDFTIDKIPEIKIIKSEENLERNLGFKIPNLNSNVTLSGTFKYNQKVTKLRSQKSFSYYEGNMSYHPNKADILEDIETVLERNPSLWHNNNKIDRELRDTFGLVLVDEDIDFYKNITNLKYEN